MVETEPMLIGAREIAERMGVSRSMAYKVIKELNSEMERRGCKTIRGRVSSEYFEETYFGKRAARDDR